MLMSKLTRLYGHSLSANSTRDRQYTASKLADGRNERSSSAMTLVWSGGCDDLPVPARLLPDHIMYALLAQASLYLSWSGMPGCG